jgi:hypothetical protein
MIASSEKLHFVTSAKPHRHAWDNTKMRLTLSRGGEMKCIFAQRAAFLLSRTLQLNLVDGDTGHLVNTRTGHTGFGCDFV